MASAMPVLPEVESRIVLPGTSRPRARPSSIILTAGRSFTEPPGLNPSSFAHIRTPAATPSRTWRISRSGVLPTRPATERAASGPSVGAVGRARAAGPSARARPPPVFDPCMGCMEARGAGGVAKRLRARIGDRLDRLVAVAGDTHHDRLVARNAALLDELLRDRDGRAAGGLREDPLRASEEPDPFDDLRVGHRFSPATRLAHRLQHVVPVGRVADRDRLGD